MDRDTTIKFDTGWQALHIDKPFAGRALTAQYMPSRPDITRAIAAEGKAEGRLLGRGSGTNSHWPIAELQIGDVYGRDGFGKVIEGTLIGSNLGNAVAAHTHTGFVFDGGILATRRKIGRFQTSMASIADTIRLHGPTWNWLDQRSYSHRTRGCAAWRPWCYVNRRASSLSPPSLRRML